MMIVLVTDFGLQGPYMGQMHAVLHRLAPNIPVVDLFADLPAYDIKAAAYLLAAYSRDFAPGTVFCCVVDPGVGSTERQPVIVEAGGYFFVGPDNGLFERVVAVDNTAINSAQCWHIDYQPEQLSNTFHGRDLFAPVAALIARGERPYQRPFPAARSLHPQWPADTAAIIYIDHFGNAMTGIRGAALADDARLRVNGQELAYARTFSEVPAGQAFWYRNANDLVELAVNRGSAAQQLDLHVSLEVIRVS